MNDFLTVKEVAKLLNISKVSVRKLIHTGKLRAVRIIKEYRIYKSSLDEFLGVHHEK